MSPTRSRTTPHFFLATTSNQVGKAQRRMFPPTSNALAANNATGAACERKVLQSKECFQRQQELREPPIERAHVTD